MRKTKSLGNRLIALALSIVLVLGMLPVGVFAETDAAAYGRVESLTDGVAITQVGKDIKVTFAGQLHWVAANPGIGRNYDGWWIGLKMIAPETLNLEKAKYLNGTQERVFKEVRDSADSDPEQYVGLWSLVTEAYLRSANMTDGFSTYTWKFDWDGNGEYEQTMTLDIDAARTILYKNNTEQVYPVALVGDGTATGITAGGNVEVEDHVSTITYADVALEWAPKDPYAGRGQDGWWVGVKMTAPAHMTKEADFTDVTYQRCDGNTWSEAKSFWNAQDSDKNAEETERYLTMWGLITPELIESELSNADDDGFLTYQWRFDWNKDGLHEQDLVLKIDAASAKLLKDGIQQFPLRFGQVEALTGGTVTGSNTANSVLPAQNITLNWSPKNPAIGRMQDGWWVGAKITAPEGMTKAEDFANVTYKRYENGAWSSEKSFWNAQDSNMNAVDTPRYLTVWGLITPEKIAASGGNMLSYMWCFDWNQDGVYEQNLTLNLDPSSITLLNENLVQIYPVLGTVTPLTNGTVTGSGTGEATVLIDNAELTWVEADEEIGRVQDGWWVGMKVTAPAGTDCENVTYRRKQSGGWTEARPFAPDSGTQDTMQMWGLVTAEYLQKFSDLGRNMTYTWQFNWDGDDTFEQTVSLAIAPSGIKLNQAGFAFVQDSDTIVYDSANNIYTVKAPAGGQSGEVPVYTVDDETVAVSNGDGTLTILKAGTVKVTATLGGDYYNPITASYTLNVQHAEQTGFGLKNPPAEIVWQAEPIDPMELVEGLVNDPSTGDVTWSVKGESDVAAIVEGKLVLYKAGDFTLQVQKAGDDRYNASAVVETQIKVLHRDQEGFGFAAESDTVTYNDVDKNAEEATAKANQYTMTADGGQSTGDVTYTVIAGDAAAFETDGVLTIYKSGAVQVEATKAGDDRYNASVKYFTLNIEKADQSLTFQHDEKVSIKYGQTFQTQITASELNSGKITYAISENTIGASVDADGLVTFVNSADKVDEVTVTVTMVEDDCYNPFSKTYTIDVSYEDVPDVPYSLFGDKKISGSDWFTGDVTIVAPDGYQISYSNALDNEDWGNKVVWNKDGCPEFWAKDENKNDAPVVYLKNTGTNAITDAIAVTDLKRDTEAPEELAISYEVSVLAQIGEKLFGFSAAEVQVTISATDAMSGIGKLEYSLEEGKDGSYQEATLENGVYTFTVAPEHRSQLWIKATDVAGNEDDYKHLNAETNLDQVLVVDSTAPGLNVSYGGLMDNNATEDPRKANSEKVTVEIVVSDENYDLRGEEPTVVLNIDELPAWVVDDKTGTMTIELTEEGDYILYVEFTDRLSRKVSYDSEIRIDRTAPKIVSSIENGKYYTENQEFVLTVTEHNFDSSKVQLTIDARDSKNNPLLNDAQVEALAAWAKDPENWLPGENADEHILKMPVKEDGNYTLTVTCTDAMDWATTYDVAFTMDHGDPNLPILRYEVGEEKGSLIEKTILVDMLEKLFGFAKETVTVTVQTGDVISGVDYLEYKTHENDPFQKAAMNADGLYQFELDPQYRGIITVVVYDKAGHSTQLTEEREIVVDNIAPEVTVAFTGNRKDAVKKDTDAAITRQTMNTPDHTTRFIYNGDVTATIQVKEANFFPDNEDMAITVMLDGAEVADWAAAGITDSGWSLAEGIYTRTLVMTQDGDYRISVLYQDYSENGMDWTSDEYGKLGKYQYESNIHTIDTTAPVYEITYTNEDLKQVRDGREYYNQKRAAIIKVTDRNFRPDEVVFSVAYTEAVGTPEFSKLLTWKDWTQDGITWTAEVPFNWDANYTVDFAYEDIAGNPMVNKDDVEEVYHSLFTVDTAIPTDLSVTYKPKSDLVNKILGTITFGHHEADQEVILSMKDTTAGIDYIALTVTPDGPECATNLQLPQGLEIWADGTVKDGSAGFVENISSKLEAGVLTLTFDVPAQFRGKVSFTAYDKSTNNSADHADPGTLVVDTTAPNYSVSYNASNVVVVDGMVDLPDYDPTKGIVDINSEKAERVMYFNGAAVATIQIEEANFDPTQVFISVQDAQGNAVTDWQQSEWTTATEEGKTDVHTTIVTIPNDGDYRIKVDYQDHSLNTPVDYLSQWIVVDTQAPKITVAYTNTEVQNTFENRNYFAQAQSAVITIEEHNFRADDVQLLIGAGDVWGNALATLELNEDGFVTAYLQQGKGQKDKDSEGWTAYEAGTWRNVDDKFEITVNFTENANYTFDIAYKDLAGNDAADYTPDLFTVDSTAPEDLQISYSQNVFDRTLNKLFFGYYNAQMTVEISAKDDISGIHYFVYSYLLADDVSKVNAEMKDIQIEPTDTSDGRFTATFKIPMQDLTKNNQFNGSVNFIAHNRSKLSTLKDHKDEVRIVVDNIAPTATITYNAPVQTANGISYYAGNIDAQIVINEANFDSADVAVSVKKNGENYPVKVAWRNNSVDVHTGTFTLTEDGNYVVSVEYQDKSENRMNSYTSNQLTLDTTKPVIKVSNIKANSANKDETYGFVIEMSDINLDATSLNPTLKAVVQTAEGKYEIVQIDLGEATAVVKDQTYTYTVENLPDDGLYTLICQVKDMSANVTSSVVLDDGQTYEQVQFSINRNGSTFGYGTQFTELLVSQYFVYSVDEDIIIVEVNVDPIEEYKVTLNGNELTEGTDYVTEQTSNEGEWSKRTYSIKKSLFEAEGEYNIIVTSVDKAETTAYSDIKNLSLAFVVDQTAPVLTISGLESNGRYQTELQKVTLIPTDEGGRLNSLQVLLLDASGNPAVDDNGKDISVLFNMAGDELYSHLEANDGMVSFHVPEVLNHQVRIICNDCAVDAEDKTNEYNELFTRITVSANKFIIFYANTGLFVGTIVGVLAVAALIIILIAKKKSKKKNVKAKA